MIPEFEEIYAHNRWNGSETRSGPGSTTWATEHLGPEIVRIATRLHVSRVLDAGCGEGTWMPELPGYIGIDPVPYAIERAREHHPDRAYVLGDLRTGMPVLPRVDLVITRDVMQHLPLADGVACLETFRRTGASHLLASTYTNGANTDIEIGGCYSPDLRIEPFNLGEPLETIFDGRMSGRAEDYPEKVLCLWHL